MGLLVDIIFNICFFMIMISMGTSISWDVLKERLKQPKGIVIAWSMQFLILPFLAYFITEVLDLNSIYSVALKIQSMCPGGVLSNIWTLVTLGDLPLSIACTSISSISALFMMPLWIAVYLPNEDSIDFAEAILDIILGLALVIGGTGFGMYLVHYHKEWSDTANRLTGPSIVAMMIIALVGPSSSGDSSPWNPDEPGKTLLAAFFIPGMGLLLTVLAGTLLGLPTQQRMAIAFETSCQNSPLCIALLYQIYSGDDRDKAVVIPLLYGIGGFCFNFPFAIIAYKSGWSYGDKSKSYCENLKEAREKMINGESATVDSTSADELNANISVEASSVDGVNPSNYGALVEQQAI